MSLDRYLQPVESHAPAEYFAALALRYIGSPDAAFGVIATIDTDTPVLSIAGIPIHWPGRLYGYQPWSGQQTLPRIIARRKSALIDDGRAHAYSEDDLFHRRVAIGGSCGLDARTTPTDVGCSLDAHGIEVATCAAAELLAVLGAELAMVGKHGPGEMSYYTLSPAGSPSRFGGLYRKWVFAVRAREHGSYYRVWDYAREVPSGRSVYDDLDPRNTPCPLF